MDCVITIKLKTGKVIELTPEEYNELFPNLGGYTNYFYPTPAYPPYYFFDDPVTCGRNTTCH